jgi:tetratricopeptide (TPR) repeat protein
MTAQEHFEKGKEFLKEEEFKAALLEFDQAIALNSKSPEYWTNKALAHLKLIQFSEGITACEKAIEINPDFAPAFGRLASLNYELDDFYNSIKLADHAISLDPSLEQAYNIRGVSFVALDCHETAIHDFSKCIDIAPSEPDNYHNRGMCLLALGQKGDALLDFEKTIQLNPDFAKAFEFKGGILLSFGQFEEALEATKQAIKLEPSHSKSFKNLGAIYIALGQNEKAVSALNKAIELDAKDPQSYNLLSDVYEKKGEWNMALTFQKKAIQLDPDNSILHCNLGHILGKMGRYEESIENYEKAILLNSYDPHPWYGKFLSEYRNGNKYISKSYIFRAFHLGPSSKIIKDLLLNVSVTQPTPFLTFRVISEHLSPDRYGTHAQIIADTLQTSIPFLYYLTYRNLTSDSDLVFSFHWRKWLGIINYHMGDPLKAFEILRQLIDTPEAKRDLSVWFYLILSCFDFAEDATPFIDQAQKLSHEFCDKTPDIGEDKINQYYAGQILLLNGEPEKALKCLLPIIKTHLPAAYLAMDIYHQQDQEDMRDKLIELILDLENNGANGFLYTPKPKQLSMDQENFEELFEDACFHVEISGPVNVLLFTIGEEDTQNPAFWECFTMTKEDQEKIASFLREHILKVLFDDLHSERAERLLEIRSNYSKDQFSAIQDKIDIEPRKVRLTIEELEKGNEKKLLVKYLGEHIETLSLPPEKYYQLIAYYYLKGDLEEYDQFLLEAYTTFHTGSKKLPHELWFVFLKDSLKSNVGEILTNLITLETFGFLKESHIAIKIGASVLTVFFRKGISAVLSELMLQWFKGNYTKSISFEDFKKDFEQFVGKEKDKLGKAFNEKYPIHGFEELIQSIS